MEIETVSKPAWADDTRNYINCSVKFAGMTEAVPFTASASDTVGYGRQLFADLVAGKFGDIAPFSPDVSVLKAEKLAEITGRYNDACQASVSFTTGAGDAQTFQADTGSQQVLQASIAGLAGMKQTPPGFAWLALDNTPVPFTFADLQSLAQVMYLQGYQAFVKLQQLKTQLNTAKTVKEINAVVWQ